MSVYREQTHNENLALTIKCILDCKRDRFKVKHLKRYSRLDGYLLSAGCRSLANDGYLKIEKGNIPTYFVKSFELLKSYYEEFKGKVDKEFVRLVLEE
jgi:hypothetical protein